MKHVVPKPRLTKILAALVVAMGFAAKSANAASSEMAGGLVAGRFSPKYASQLKGSPELPTTLLMTGAEVTYVKHNVLIGGRAWSGSTHSSNDTSGSLYTVNSLAVLLGWAAQGNVMDINIGTGLGIGTTTYSTASTTAPLIFEASYLGIEPLMTIGFYLANNFKVSIGGGYQVGYVYDVSQKGPSTSHLEKPNDKATVGGLTAFAKFSFLAY